MLEPKQETQVGPLQEYQPYSIQSQPQFMSNQRVKTKHSREIIMHRNFLLKMKANMTAMLELKITMTLQNFFHARTHE